MRAVVAHAVGGPVRVDEVTLMPPGDDEVRVAIAAAGLCHTDLSYVDGTLPGAMPVVLGHEASGTVVECGQAVQSVRTGDPVLVNWLPSCGACFHCTRGEFHLCRVGAGERGPRHLLNGRAVRALAGVGAFADEVVVAASSVVRLPGDVPLDLAALLGCAVLTGFGAAVNTAAVTAGATVAVIGCGGVGLNVVQGARHRGAAVILAVDPVSAKREAAQLLGATHVSPPGDLTGLTGEITGPGFDFVFEAVGTSATVRAAWEATRRGGTTVVVGAGSPHDLVSFSLLELFVSEKRLVGSLLGSCNVSRDVPLLIELWRSGRLRLDELVARRITMDAVPAALEEMRNGSRLRQLLVPSASRSG